MPLVDFECEKCSVYASYNTDYGVEHYCKNCKANDIELNPFKRTCLNCSAVYRTSSLERRSCPDCFSAWIKTQQPRNGKRSIIGKGVKRDEIMALATALEAARKSDQ